MFRSYVLLGLVAATSSSGHSDAGLLVTMYSDAQCPCSAQFVSDVKHILDNAPFNSTQYKMVQFLK